MLWGFQNPLDPANVNGQVDDLSNDSLFGGNGNDTAYGAGGNDLIDGGAGNDLLFGGNGNDNILGGQNDDFIFGENGADTLTGGTGNDSIFGGNGNDVLTGFDPAVNGSNQLDTLTGGSGADYFIVNGGSPINPAYSFNGNADFVVITDFSGVGYPDTLDPSNGDPGEGDKIQLLAALKDYYIFGEGSDDLGSYKDISLNKGFSLETKTVDLIARVYEPTGFLNVAQDIVYV